MFQFKVFFVQIIHVFPKHLFLCFPLTVIGVQEDNSLFNIAFSDVYTGISSDNDGLNSIYLKIMSHNGGDGAENAQNQLLFPSLSKVTLFDGRLHLELQ